MKWLCSTFYFTRLNRSSLDRYTYDNSQRQTTALTAIILSIYCTHTHTHYTRQVKRQASQFICFLHME